MGNRVRRSAEIASISIALAQPNHIDMESGVVVIHHARWNRKGLIPLDSSTVRDNGRGVEDFAKLLDLGGSGWEEALESSEDPAGVGLFCLAPREATIRSKGKMVTISGDGWLPKAQPVRFRSF